ncbi:ABC transporter ATP-binding protein [Vibrio sp.]|nr:ABC transporter ATP-binding protein [Vibrio sp.]
MATAHYSITLNDVLFYWPKADKPTLHIPNLRIEVGKALFIKGPSGCGKSTLLSLLTGINTPTSGDIHILDRDMSTLSAGARDAFRANHIGYIFQQFNLIPYLSVLENVTLPCHFSTSRKKNVTLELEEQAKQILLNLQLPEHLIHSPVIELSIGQQQRVAAARALIGSPEIIIADEPTSALDHDNRSTFLKLLLTQVRKTHSTLIFVSHDPTIEHHFDEVINLMALNKAAETQL